MPPQEPRGLQQRAPAASAPSQTITQTSHPPEREEAPRVLRLRGARARARAQNERSVQWADDVVDNEGLGRKSSKVCCIYHKPKPVDESSDESSSDSSSESSGNDSDAGDKARRVGGGGKGHDHDCGHSHGGHRHGRRKKRDGDKKRPPSPNAYEKVPKPKPKPEEASGSGS